MKQSISDGLYSFVRKICKHVSTCMCVWEKKFKSILYLEENQLCVYFLLFSYILINSLMEKYLLNFPTLHKTDKSENKVIKSLKYKENNEIKTV